MLIRQIFIVRKKSAQIWFFIYFTILWANGYFIKISNVGINLLGTSGWKRTRNIYFIFFFVVVFYKVRNCRRVVSYGEFSALDMTRRGERRGSFSFRSPACVRRHSTILTVLSRSASTSHCIDSLGLFATPDYRRIFLSRGAARERDVIIRRLLSNERIERSR